jgi:16S rRNA (cytosine967-C5)-methyltransferase
MTPSARLQAVLDLLGQLAAENRPADALTSHFFRARRFIGSKDRGAIADLTYDIIRHQGRLEWWLGRLGMAEKPRNRLLAYLALVEQRPATEITSLFSGGKYAPAALTGEEQGFLTRLKGHTLLHPDMSEGIIYECPSWAEASLRQRFGQSFRRELAALLEPATLDLRINPLKITREAALQELADTGITATATPYSPLGIRVPYRLALNSIALLKTGALEIQDEGSQLVALLLDAKPGERVVDFCAGAGGKTLVLAAAMQNKGRIVACDVLAKRLERSTERFRKAGFHNIEIKPLASERDPWVKHHKGDFDRVLVDAPCSGTGTWRRNPDQRWRSLGPGLDNLLPLQQNILDSAARLVKPGGRLVYATCSLLSEENEQQIEQFLANHTDFSLVPVREAVSIASLPDTGDMLSLSPAKHHTDGFFGAVMVRAAK